jgi:glycosyltransferase involved in cell wall biosynthesis
MAGEATVSGGSLQSNKVSVVITTVGHPGLARAVHSALSQTLPPLQVIVVDDRVASETPDLDLALSDPRVVVTRTFGGGANHARNRGIHLASGEVIALLDDDDFWFANKLERQLTTLLGSQELDRTLVTCQAYMESARAIYPKRPFADGDLADYLFCRHFPHIRFDSFVQTSSLMFARSLALRLPFREGLSSHQDWDWLLSLRAASVSFVTLPEPLYFYSAPSPGGISAAARPAAGYQWAMHALPEGSAALFGYGSIIAVPRALRARDYGFARAAIRYSLRHGQFHGWTALMGIAYSVLSLSRPSSLHRGPRPQPSCPSGKSSNAARTRPEVLCAR